jgi:cytochrome c oxidase cbb3-type subunit IV
MSAAWGHLVGVLTVLIMLSFIGIWLWAWLPHHKSDFDRLARLPMGDDATPARDDDGEEAR